MKEIKICSYADNRPLACRPDDNREPIVQILAFDEGGELQSIRFGAKQSRKIAMAIQLAGEAALANEKMADAVVTTELSNG